MEENVLTIPEAAKVLKVGRTTLYKLIKQGEIPIVKVGSLNRVLESDLQAYLQKQKNRGGKIVQAHPDNLETKTFAWNVNSAYDLSIEVETVKPGTMTSYLPIEPALIAFQVERDGNLIIRTSDAYFRTIRGKRVLVIKKELDVAVELPVNIAKALWPHDYMLDPVDGKNDVWWQFE